MKRRFLFCFFVGGEGEVGFSLTDIANKLYLFRFTGEKTQILDAENGMCRTFHYSDVFYFGCLLLWLA